MKHVLSLDHADTPDAGGDDEAAGNGRGPKTNMNWLTKSDIAGLPSATGIVLETIQQANRDVPEVTQVRARLLGVRVLGVAGIASGFCALAGWAGWLVFICAQRHTQQLPVCGAHRCGGWRSGTAG